MRHTLIGSTFDSYLEINNKRFEAPQNSVPDAATVRVHLDLQPHDKYNWREGFELKDADSAINGKLIDWMDLLDDPWDFADLALNEMVEDDNARRYG